MEHPVTPRACRLGNRSANLQLGPTETQKASSSGNRELPARIPWTKEEMKTIMWCHYWCRENGKLGYINTYKKWRELNPNKRLNIDANKLQNQRRYIEQNGKLTEAELLEIENNVKKSLEEEHNNREQETQTQRNNQQIINTLPTINSEETNQYKEKSDLERSIRNEFNRYSNIDFNRRIPLKRFNRTPISKGAVEIANKIISESIEQDKNMDLLKLNNLIYSIARAVTEVLTPSTQKSLSNKNNKQQNKIPPWQYRIIQKIDNARKDLSTLVAINQGAEPKSKSKLIKKYKISAQKQITTVIEELKQTVTAKTQRLRRYKKRTQQYQQNKLFESDTKKFYRSLQHKEFDLSSTPSKEQIDKYWRELYETEKNHNTEATWIPTVIEQNKYNKMEWSEITTQDIKLAARKLQGWKAPGPDKIQNFWLKHLTNIYEILAQQYNTLINHPEQYIPTWLAEGNTYLLPKNSSTENPKNYRPITCLNTMYKLLTSIIAEKMTKYISNHDIIPVEQKGCCKNSMGCKDQLLYSKAVLQDCKKHKRSLQLAWIDYKKAFDSVPHSWILKSLETVGIHPTVLNFCKHIMPLWKTKIQLHAKNQTVTTDEINIKRGIFQGDSLSPLLFCIALTPLTTILNNECIGYKMKNTNVRVSHLLYMDDLKVLAESKNQLCKSLQKIKSFSDDIGMEFGLEKCAVASFKKGELQEMNNITLPDKTTLTSLEHGDVYKYLGIDEKDTLDDTDIKQKLRKEYIARVRKILQTELYSRNKITAIGSLAVPVLQYSFNVVEWRMDEIRELDRKTRKLLNIYHMLHPRADVERLYASREKGGRGLRHIETAYNMATVSTCDYITKAAMSDKCMHAFQIHDMSQSEHTSIQKRAKKIDRKLFPNQGATSEEHQITQQPLQHTTIQIKNELRRQLRSIWINKPLHGQIHRTMSTVQNDEKFSFSWLKYGDLKGESESLLTAAQDQAIRTKYLECRIFKTSIDATCRLCKQFDETIYHLMSGCPVLARKEYIDRHNKVCSQIHFNICKHYDCDNICDKWYDHQPEKVTVNRAGDTTILYDHPVLTDRTVDANRPDIIIREKNMTYLIDIAVPNDQNIIAKEAEKILKYASLSIEIKRMWKTPTTVIPIIIGTTGYVSKSFLRYIKEIPGKHNPYAIQKTALLGTAHILRKVTT